MAGETTGGIFGRVTDEFDNPVGNARVYVTSAPVAVPDIAALTDSEGNFGLPAPAAGDYTLECNAEGRTTTAITVTVASDEPAPADISLASE